ncbi:MAG: flippase-like domain-containing protein [Bacteroidetes bacterium]|nr:flippase-like domain-containing protein [Bacteroidota bacterium]
MFRAGYVLIDKLKKNILISIAAAALIYLALSIYADYKEVAKAFSIFNWLWFPILLILSYLNYFTRFLKWNYYLKLLKFKVSLKASFDIFMSGLVMSVTPGKFGELLKSIMLKKVADIPISKSAPIILVERITDFLSLLIIALIGTYFYGIGTAVVFSTLAVFIILVIFLSNKKLAGSALKLFSKIKFINKYIENFEHAYQSSYIMLKPEPLIKMTVLSFVSWFFECFGFYIILINFDLDITVMWSSFVYAFSTIVGSLTLLPGGLGVTDGSLTFLMVNNNIDKFVAVASTLIIRVATLWFAVLVGMISVIIFQNRFGKIEFNNNAGK